MRTDNTKDGEKVAGATGSERCPKCGSLEVESNTPRTTYACGSYTYDARPGTFRRGDFCESPNSEINDALGRPTIRATSPNACGSPTAKGESVPTFRRPICHTLKTLPEYLEAVGCGEKTFEVRRNDRDFLNGDGLHLREWHSDSGTYGFRSITCRVSYVLKGAEAIKFGVRPGFCVLGIKLPADHQWPPNAQPLSDGATKGSHEH